MQGKNVRVRSSEGGEFDCYQSRLAAAQRFRRSCLHPPCTGSTRIYARSRTNSLRTATSPRRPICSGARSRAACARRRRHQAALTAAPGENQDGEADLADTLAGLRKLPQSNGRAAVIGFCYGGPYAILAPKRLGYDAGISCHGSQMLDYIRELEGLARPVCIIWGDADHQAPAEVLDAYRGAAARMKNLELHIFPGVLHGYMMPDNAKAFDRKTREFSMARALAILEGLRGGEAGRRKAG